MSANSDNLVSVDYDFDSEWNPGVGSYHTKTVAALADEYERVQGPKAKQAWLEERERFWLDRTKVQLTKCHLPFRDITYFV
jgi:hypothetical protein